jgi:hypothetical protein
MTCVRCDGTGLVEFTGGTHELIFWMRGNPVTRQVEATPDRPVYKRCGCVKATPVTIPQPQGVYE